MPKPLDQLHIAICGTGNMGAAALAGFLRAGVSAAQISAFDADADRLWKTSRAFQIYSADSISDAIRDVDILVIAVKPKDVAALGKHIRAELSPDTLVVSVAAGLTTEDLAGFFAPGQRIVRVMPNTPAAIGAGVSAISAGATATDEDVEHVRQLFAGCGMVVVVPEAQQAAVGALSGSGPAYVFYLLDALAEAGVVNGLPRDLAGDLAVQTVLGSARMIAETGEHPVLARERVTSPGGTTAAALRELDSSGVRAAIIRAVDAAVAQTAGLRS